MNNKPTNQSKPNRFHLKTWQWLSVLIIAAVIAGGVFVVWDRGTQVLPQDQNDIKEAINKLPVVSDCRQTANKEDWLDKEPTEEWEEYVNKKASILQNFKIRSGYKVGRIRAERHGFPSGYDCLSYFDVSVLKCDGYPGSCVLNKGKLLSHSKTPEAFILEENDLENTGWLLYGDLIGREALLQKYNRAKEKPLCSESKTGFDCNQENIKELPQFQDGEIVLENGKRTLHRYSTGCSPHDCLYHYTIFITAEGKLKIDKEKIYYVNTGIMS